MNLFGYVKDSIVRTVTGCGQLYTNHQRCNEIRQKQTIYRNTVKEQWTVQGLYDHLSDKEIQQKLIKEVHGGISYEEYIFLQMGKDDRGKVLNLGFLMWGAPRVLPYALMFNKNMLPSPFTVTSSGSTTSSEATYDTLRRDRTQAIINTLLNMEKQMMTITGNNFMSNLNIFSKSKPKTNVTSATTSESNSKSQALQTIVSGTSDIFRSGLISSSPTSSSTTTSQKAAASYILQRCEPYLYRTTHEYTGLEQRLGHIPSCIVQGISNAVFGHGIPNVITQLTPAVFHRRKLIGHIEKITKADDFLIRSQIDVSTIPKRLLQEACQDRMIDIGSHRSIQDLRNSLSDWLQLTIPKVQPSMMQTSSDTEVITASTSVSPLSPTIYHNSNLARMILLAYYGCSAICDSQSICRLPQLLLQNCNRKGD
jgi:LETM1-like protein